ncbi:MAG: CoA transferase, partial [Rhodoferax sp.]|nr:CoA transferase [Rhodoferax sp.]MCB2042750.1 CoA transferase [Rhodoferax sp.]
MRNTDCGYTGPVAKTGTAVCGLVRSSHTLPCGNTKESLPLKTHPNTGALAGVRILDMATVLAAPFGATLCADHGAEVVKLELPDGSDPLRGLQPVKDGVPLWWKVANRGKKGITLDVRKPQGRELLLRMLAQFDVLVENFRTGTMDRWGLDAQTLLQANPRLVILRLTGFGQTGPYA